MSNDTQSWSFAFMRIHSHMHLHLSVYENSYEHTHKYTYIEIKINFHSWADYIYQRLITCCSFITWYQGQHVAWRIFWVVDYWFVNVSFMAEKSKQTRFHLIICSKHKFHSLGIPSVTSLNSNPLQRFCLLMISQSGGNFNVWVKVYRLISFITSYSLCCSLYVAYSHGWIILKGFTSRAALLGCKETLERWDIVGGP